MKFELAAPYQTSPGQKEAIDKIISGFSRGEKQTLLGITGSGKTFVMANIIQSLQKPTLIIAHNKTLAAQLYGELKNLFPNNRVEYFISYYDYYQPESYMPTTDTYIEKDSAVNERIEKMRLRAISSLLSRKDTIVVASISCIYGIGNPDDVRAMSVAIKAGSEMTRQSLLLSLIEMRYERNDLNLEPGKFRARGDVVDIIPAYDENIVRIELEEGKVKTVKEVDALTGNVTGKIDEIVIYPSKQYVVPGDKQKAAMDSIRKELEERLPELPPLESQRLGQRVKYDLEMIEAMGYCNGIENYSRHFDGRAKGQPAAVLIDYFPKDFLLIIDESHQTVPQAKAMYNGDHMRKKNLVDFGFRLPSAFDNRPLKFEELEKKMGRTLFVSATPAEYELGKSAQVTDLITRPTGLLDPTVEVRPSEGQMNHMMSEARKTIASGNRVFVTTLTKRMAEDLTEFLSKKGFKVRYMHSEIGSLERIELIRQLRVKEFDILVGINLLREGLDIPEVGTIFILDADKEGFLRDERSLIQTMGRASRNVDGRVVLYADKMTRSIKRAVEVTDHRRSMQIEYNKRYGIVPKTIVKSIEKKGGEVSGIKHMSDSDVRRQLIELDAKMRLFAENLNFEKAIELRDRVDEMKKLLEARTR